MIALTNQDIQKLINHTALLAMIHKVTDKKLNVSLEKLDGQNPHSIAYKRNKILSIDDLKS